jgi:hypothetical protein
MLRKESTEKVSLGLKCDDCLHYKDGTAKFEKVCCELGVDPRSKAPDCYSPNIYKIRDVKNPDLLHQLGKLLKDIGPSQTRIISFILARQGGALAKHGLKFGQPIYFSLGKDYVSHYFKGYVVSADSEYVYATAKLKKCKTNTSLTVPRSSVLTYSEYKALEKKLLEKGRIFMNNEEKRFCKKLPIAEQMDSKGRVPHVEQFQDDYEPPTLDSAPESWFNVYQADVQRELKKRDKKKGKKSGKRIPTVETNDRGDKVFSVTRSSKSKSSPKSESKKKKEPTW